MADYNSMASEYAKHRQVHPRVLENLLSVSHLCSSSKVLEVGCGTANYVIALKTAVDCRCWGVDPSEQMLASARRRSAEISFQCGRAEKLSFTSDLFDLVFSVDVIHHVGGREEYLREAYRVLRKGGRICTVTDSEDMIRGRRPLATYFPETIDVDLRRYPRICELKELMGQAGFGGIAEATVEFPYTLTDIQAYRDRAFSSLHLISESAFERGIAQMERDLATGAIPCLSRYLLLWGTK